ncbi:MAG TPA: hypothetical protein VH682_01320 [Gemmataceae bacterium]|jgi:hypothetical protein
MAQVSLLLLLGSLASAAADAPSVEQAGMLIPDSSLPGERRADDVVPRHACCVQASRRRWIIVYYTHGFRGVDDERSVLYQVRADAPDGKVLREGFLARTVTDWKPQGAPPAPEGTVYFKQHGHAVVYGVPKGAVVAGKPLPHANLFVAQWRIGARLLDLKRDLLLHARTYPEVGRRTAAVEWVQFRLNDREDDIEVVVPPVKLRLANGKLPVGANVMNQSFCQPVPANDQADVWLTCNHFDGGRLAVLKIQFDAKRGRYAWTETGPFLDADKPLSEASLARLEDGWVVSARSSKAIAWLRADAPLGRWTAARFTAEPALSAPHTTFRYADGVVRLLAGDGAASPQKYDRDPMYMWDVSSDGDGVRLSNRRVVFDSEAQRVAIRKVVRPRVDFGILFPPHGREQIIAFSVTPRGFNFPYGRGTSIPPVTAADKKASGLYFVRIRYPRAVPPAWQFD